jgi:hypothetical protein
MRSWPLIGAACGTLLGLVACSNPNSPSTFITITGTATLTLINQTSQLTAKTSTGQDVTAQATWQSSNPAVATVSSTGLLTARGPGGTAITATDQGATGTLTVSVLPPAVTNAITSCGVISTPGAYFLQTDISQAVAAGLCLAIQANNVQLDCRNHRVTSLGFGAVNSVTVTNCSVANAMVNTYGLTNVTLAHNTLTGGWSSSGSQHLTLTANHVSGSGVLLSTASFAVLTDNTFDSLTPTLEPAGAGAAVGLFFGNNNQVSQNTIDGGYDGSGTEVGVDDGVVLQDEANDTIQSNSISNAFDSGIEGVDVVQSTTIARNTIINAGTAGIGAFLCTSWTGNVIAGNSVSLSPRMLYVIYRVDAMKCGSPIPVGSFTNNQVTGNRFVSPTGNGVTPGMSISLDAVGPHAVLNNLIQGNDLGTASALVLSPGTGFINGGGNVCAPLSSPFCGGSELKSLSASPLSRRRHGTRPRRSHRGDYLVQTSGGRATRITHTSPLTV